MWVQVSTKLLNLKGLCVDHIPCILLIHIQTILLLENIYNFHFLHVRIQEFKASSIKTQSHFMSYVMFQYIIFHIIFSLYIEYKTQLKMVIEDR